MSMAKNKINLFQAHNDSSIASIARTVNAAFASDPLIQWLRPNAQPWARQSPKVLKWQNRRIQSVMAEGMVFYSSDVIKMARENQRKGEGTRESLDADNTSLKSPQVSLYEEQAGSPTSEDAGAVVFLFPPKRQIEWSLTRVLRRCKLWLLNIISPADDEGCEMKRVDSMMKSHSTSLECQQRKYRGDLWYLEVIAVHPSLQSRGIGRNVMNWILDYTQKQPIYLECTQERNISFYESFGFRVVEEIVLTPENSHGEDETVKFWAMIKSQNDSI